MEAIHLNLWKLAAPFAAAIGLSAGAAATPEFAAKEKRPCSFCHVSPAGGGELTAAGKYYVAHNKSLKGLPISFKSLWKAEAPAETRRIALGNVLGDGKVRLLTLGSGDELSIMEWADAKLSPKTSLKLGPGASSVFVANLEKDKPAVVAVPGAVYVHNDEGFKRLKASALTAISGIVQFTDGEQCVFQFDGMSEPAVFGVKSDASNPLTVGPAMVYPEQGAGVYSWVVARFPSDALAMLGWPAEAAKTPVLGLYDPRGDENLKAWMIWKDAKGERLILADPGAILGAGTINPVWSSASFAGKVLDVTIGRDPRDSNAVGFLVLTEDGKEGTGRALEFLALD